MYKVLIIFNYLTYEILAYMLKTEPLYDNIIIAMFRRNFDEKDVFVPYGIIDGIYLFALFTGYVYIFRCIAGR